MSACALVPHAKHAEEVCRPDPTRDPRPFHFPSRREDGPPSYAQRPRVCEEVQAMRSEPVQDGEERVCDDTVGSPADREFKRMP